jgi:hypothetical protein
MDRRLEAVDSGLLYANRYPADWAINAYFPCIVELAPGELLCVYRRSAAMYSDDGRSHIVRSTDGGKSWTDQGMVHDGSGDDRPYSYSATKISRLQDGQLVLTGLRFSRPSPDMPLFNDETGGHLPLQGVLFRSADSGKTWSRPEVIQDPESPGLVVYSGIAELSDGRWFLTCDNDKSRDDPTPMHPHVSGLISDDRGRTWGEKVPVAGSPDSENTFWHMQAVRLADGRLIGFPWTGGTYGESFLTLHRVVGEPDARRWSAPEPTGLLAQTNRPVDLGDGYMAMIMSIRESPKPGIYVGLSDDEGKTWDTGNLVQIWDAYGQDSLGVPRTESYPASHDNIAFGAPDAVRLHDGDIMASFWAGQQGQMVCRWCRLRAA